MKISDVFKKEKITFSFEFFPPKDEISAVEFGIHVGRLMKLDPSFVSVTYGAGGSTQERTFNLVDLLQNKIGMATMAHYTCVNATREKVASDLNQLHESNILNLMLLRGDPPKGEKTFVPKSDQFQHASDLVEYAKKLNQFCIGGAAYPEVHFESKSPGEDIYYLKKKVDSGADFLVTQVFFDNRHYFNFLEKTKEAGIDKRIIPGIIPITSFKQIKRIVGFSNSEIPEELALALEPHQDDPVKSYQIGVDYTIKQCRELLQKGAPGIHFYTLNKSRATIDVFETIKDSFKFCPPVTKPIEHYLDNVN
jgi:methylenetetrahydrofolate reductase (NADPH)